MLSKVLQFIRDAGRLGVASEIAAILLFIITLIEHTRDKTFPPWPFICMSVALFCFGGFLAWHHQLRENENLAKENQALQEKLNDVPKIDVLQHGFYADRRPLLLQAGSVLRPLAQLSCLHVKFRNDPKLATHDSIARNIRAELQFFDDSGRSLCKFQGRWGDMPQPPHLPPGQSPAQVLASADFEIGQDRELDIAFKYPDEADCFGMSNETYLYPDWRHPKQKISVGKLRVRVRLRGVGVDSSWDFWFENPQSGDLKRVKYLPVRPSD